MSTVRLRVGSSATVRSAHPGTEYGNVRRMAVRGTDIYSFVRLPLGSELRQGVTIVSATLQLTQTGAYTVPMVAQAVADGWRIRRINWNNQPGVAGMPVTATKAGLVLSFDVTADVQAMIDGDAPKQGWRISTTDGTTREMWGFAADSGSPVLVVVYAYAPAAPTDLRPSSGAVSVTKPILSWTTGEHTAVQVQIDPTGAFTAPTFDSGTVASAANSYDLSASTYGGITAGSTQWRVRVQNSQGQWSTWATPATFSYAAKPAATLSQPGATVWETTPPLKLDMTGLVRARFLVSDTADPATVVYDSGELPTTTGEHTPTRPAFVVDGHTYLVTARGWDAVVRSSTPGDPPYVTATTTTTLALDPGTAGVDWTSAAQVGATPAVAVSVSRAVMPDAFVLIRDGQRLVSDLDPNDLLVPGTTIYAYTDQTCPPQEAHTYRLAPVVNGKTAADGFGQSDTVTPRIAGIWLLDPDNDVAFQMFGKEEGSFTRPEIYVTHTLEDGTLVKRHFGYGPWQGSAAGTLADALGQTAADLEERFEQLRADPSGVYRLVKIGLNIPVVLVDPQITTQRSGSVPGKLLRAVSFGFQGV